MNYQQPLRLIANLLAPVEAGTFSQAVSQQEYSRLFERNRFGLVSSTEYWMKARSRGCGHTRTASCVSTL